MQPSRLLLDRYFFPITEVAAYMGATDIGEMGFPEISAMAFYHEPGKLVVNCNVAWGEREKTPYFIQVLAYGLFTIPVEFADTLAGLKNIAHNCSTIIFGTAREHIASVTARGPYSTAFVPGVIFEQDAVRLDIAPELAERYDSKAVSPTLVKSASGPSKKRTKKP